MISTFQNLSVKTKVIGSFAVLILIIAGIGVFAVNRFGAIAGRVNDVVDNWMPAVHYLEEFGNDAWGFREKQVEFAIDTTDDARAQDITAMNAFKADAQANLAKYAPLVDQAGEERALFDTFRQKWDSYVQGEAQLESIFKTKGPEAARAFLVGPYNDVDFTSLRKALEADIAYQVNGTDQSGTSAKDTVSFADTLIFVIIGLSLALGIAVAFALIGAVSVPLIRVTGILGRLMNNELGTDVGATDRKDEIGKLFSAVQMFKDSLVRAEEDKQTRTRAIDALGKSLDSLAQGDLTSQISAQFAPDYQALKENFNAAITRMSGTVGTVLSSASGISTGASEISQAADDLSKRTEQQAASLEETAAALEEITATVKKTAQNAKDASTIVTNAKSAAEDGGRIVETAISAMGQIASSSKQITDIIGVIDEIAFQTNLLALNAGVEAARAGDAGKGFAVVASEVRALAQRSSEAAREIKTLIKASGEQVDSGVKLVGESGDALKRIVAQVIEIDTLVTEMAQAAQQQSTGIEEVNTAVSQMDQVTQQNAAMVEESTAASRNLATETEELSRLVSYFKVDVSAATARPPEKAPAVRKPVVRPVAKPVARVAAAGGGRRAAVAAAPAGDADDWQEF